jgi:hypothetical protein
MVFSTVQYGLTLPITWKILLYIDGHFAVEVHCSEIYCYLLEIYPFSTVLKQCCGSGIRGFFTPWIRDEFFSGSRIFLTMTKTETLLPETVRSKKKVSLHSTFQDSDPEKNSIFQDSGSRGKNVRIRIRDRGWKMLWFRSGILDNTSQIRNTGFQDTGTQNARYCLQNLLLTLRYIFIVLEKYLFIRVSDPHRFYADPDPAFLLNADPDPDPDPTCRI